jgi:adenosylcobinamide-phosphate synthase
MTESSVLTFAYLLDLVIGDPGQFPHPVRGIGWAIEKAESTLIKNRRETKDSINPSHDPPPVKGEIKGGASHYALSEKKAGVILAAAIVGITYLLFYVLETLLINPGLSPLGSFLSFIIITYLVSTTLATHDLLQSGKAVIDEVSSGNIKGARKKLSMIVGRDTGTLNKDGVLKATIETLSENASDGIIAPLFYYALGGLPLAMAYKAINTLDSMVGYKNEKYKNLGWASAKLDDIANYIPARITGVLIAASAFILIAVSDASSKFIKTVKNNSEKLHSVFAKNAVKIMIRDSRKHASPNSGIPEAAMAGALGIQLGGPSTYGGVVFEKPYIGEERRSAETQTVNLDNLYSEASNKALILTKTTSFLGLVVSIAILYMRTLLWS